MVQKTTMIELGEKILSHIALLGNMSEKNIPFNMLKSFDAQQIAKCCERLPVPLTESNPSENIQRELICNPAFAAYYAELLLMFPESKQKLSGKLTDLLPLCWNNDVDITSFPQSALAEILEITFLKSIHQLIYLVNFSQMNLAEDEKHSLMQKLYICIDLPVRLDDSQKKLLCEPFVFSRGIFRKDSFSEISELLRSCPKLADFFRLLHEKNIEDCMSLADWKYFVEDAPDRYDLLASVIYFLGSDNSAKFLRFWRKNKWAIKELRLIERKVSENPELDWENIFSNYSGYVNLLYGSRFKSVHLSDAPDYLEDILAYAIIHNKKHFIHLADNMDNDFFSMPSTSFLLQESLYQDYFNLNELTEKDLSNCRHMSFAHLNAEKLVPGRRYTFPELSALYDVPDVYCQLYHLLRSDSQDYRLRVYRQLRKDNMLTNCPADYLPALAGKLDSKPLYAWMEQEFAHIDGLTTEDAVQMLALFDEVSRFLPEIKCRRDAVMILKNYKILDQADSLSDLKARIMSLDTSWARLAEEMGLNKDFQKKYQDNIIDFLCNNGVYVVDSYSGCLAHEQRKAFFRVVKAELMGQLSKLKYFEGDLQREIDMPLDTQMTEAWMRNRNISEAGMIAQEYDDFFSTMLLGTQPQKTCMSYVNGAYRECLLSAFDSNKKILYVSFRGRIVGRAFLRFTKYRLSTKMEEKGKPSFTFVDLENVSDSRQDDKEKAENTELPTLFLERPYISCVDLQQTDRVKEILVRLACMKANEMGVALTLSENYPPIGEGFVRTTLNIYISKSKAGAQYLDSLGGAAEASQEGSYRSNSFLVRK